jgi:hypothetical protein
MPVRYSESCGIRSELPVLGLNECFSFDIA